MKYWKRRNAPPPGRGTLTNSPPPGPTRRQMCRGGRWARLDLTKPLTPSFFLRLNIVKRVCRHYLFRGTTLYSSLSLPRPHPLPEFWQISEILPLSGSSQIPYPAKISQRIPRIPFKNIAKGYYVKKTNKHQMWKERAPRRYTILWFWSQYFDCVDINLASFAQVLHPLHPPPPPPPLHPRASWIQHLRI